MPVTVGNFVVAADQPLKLREHGDTRVVTFTIPAHPALTKNTRAVVSAQTEVDVQADLLGWSLLINNVSVTAFKENRSRLGAVQEEFDADLLRVGQNQAKVTFNFGQGKLEVSDLVVHYRVDI
ncbi:hypothetical protein JOD57_003338 [Geodermatophilus bullaregiensis]|uniref:hypothetical protein n=1 Tax=Geodermatophilus bullaregiensis TaxID=1564160 RepID=UPI00195C04C8|nr:hypothetical protein [Geodermatophilus bullaregiensis]MBM7807501.1 hypothetical protein [Geodermatophilus bullaregiensis]